MTTKFKKFAFLTTGLAGALVASTAAGVALSACTVTTSNSSSSDITLPDTWYSKDINWQDSTSLNNLLIDSQGIVYSNKYMTEIIAILPGYGGSTITIPASVKSISGYNNVDTSTGSTVRTATGAFEGLTSLTTVVFAGKNVTQIGGGAFKNCTNLQSITLPSSVTLVGVDAFSGCTSLNSINLDNVQYIGNNAFYNAFSNIPDGSVSLSLPKVSYIGTSAFQNATGISTVDLSKNTVLTSIGESAFSGCTNMSGTINLSNDTYLITIGASAFANCSSITAFNISSSSALTTIGESAFSGCSSLTTVGTTSDTGFVAPSSIKTISATAFANTAITTVDLTNSLATDPLAASSLSNMPELTSVNLGTKITTLNSQVFSNTPKLESLTLPSSITSIASGNGSNIGTPSTTFSSYSAFYNSGITSIDMSAITSYSTTSSSAKLLPEYLFLNCTNLQSVTLLEGTTEIGIGSFYGCSALTTVKFGPDATNTTGLVAPSTLTSIGGAAFYGTALETVDLTNLTSTSWWTSSTSAGVGANNYTFAECPNLTTVSLPTSVTYIPPYSFSNDVKLTTFNFTALTKLANIGNYNFQGAQFTSIDLTNTVIEQLNGTSLFTKLLESCTVSLPNTLIALGSDGSNNGSTIFSYEQTSESGTTSTVSLPLSFPNGWGNSSTSYSSKLLTLSSTSVSVLDHFSRVTGMLDFSNFVNLNGIGRNTLFGNTTLTGLAFNASTFATGVVNTNNNSAAYYTYLGLVGTSVTANTDTSTNPSTYTRSNLPLGGNSSLANINFTKFTNSTATTSSETATVMAKTTADTWSQVTRIINSFGKYGVTATEGETPEYVANLSTWGETSEDITPVISYDENDQNIVSSVQLNTTSGTTLLTIDGNLGSTDNTFTYAGVTWTVSVDNTAGTVTLTATGIDSYRVVVADSSGNYTTSLKAFFNTKTETTTTTNEAGEEVTTNVIVPDSNITVTLNVVTASSSN